MCWSILQMAAKGRAGPGWNWDLPRELQGPADLGPSSAGLPGALGGFTGSRVTRIQTDACMASQHHRQ